MDKVTVPLKSNGRMPGAVSDFDEIEIEEAIIKTIRKMDKGDGVTINSIISEIEAKKEIIKDILKKLTINTVIYATASNRYKLYES